MANVITMVMHSLLSHEFYKPDSEALIAANVHQAEASGAFCLLARQQGPGEKIPAESPYSTNGMIMFFSLWPVPQGCQSAT